MATGERKLHAKTAFIDDDLALVSSYNLDFLSADVNNEVAAAILSEGRVRDVQKNPRLAARRGAGDRPMCGRVGRGGMPTDACCGRIPVAPLFFRSARAVLDLPVSVGTTI